METSRSYRHERQAAVRERDDLAAVKGKRVETPVPWLGFRGLWPIGAQSGPAGPRSALVLPQCQRTGAQSAARR